MLQENYGNDILHSVFLCSLEIGEKWNVHNRNNIILFRRKKLDVAPFNNNFGPEHNSEVPEIFLAQTSSNLYCVEANVHVLTSHFYSVYTSL